MSYADNIPLFNQYSEFVRAFHSTICCRNENKEEQCFIFDSYLFNLLLFWALWKSHSLLWPFPASHNSRILIYWPLGKTSEIYLLYYKMRQRYKMQFEYWLTRSWKLSDGGQFSDSITLLQDISRPALDLVPSVLKVSW